MTNTTKIRHTVTGHKADVPTRSLPGWKLRGWVEDSKPSPKPRKAAIEMTPVETSSPESSNDTKEND